MTDLADYTPRTVVLAANPLAEAGDDAAVDAIVAEVRAAAEHGDVDATRTIEALNFAQFLGISVLEADVMLDGSDDYADLIVDPWEDDGGF